MVHALDLLGSAIVHFIDLAGLVHDHVVPGQKMLGFLVLLHEITAAATPCLRQLSTLVAEMGDGSIELTLRQSIKKLPVRLPRSLMSLRWIRFGIQCMPQCAATHQAQHWNSGQRCLFMYLGSDERTAKLQHE